MKGYLQVYTGAGKGKTTAAFGLALRALGAGLKVYIGQFIKKGDFCEIRALKRFGDDVVVRQFGRGGFIKGKASKIDVMAAKTGLSELSCAMLCGDYDMVIADELNSAVCAGLISAEELLSLVDGKPECVELIITGRGAHPLLRKRADLLTDMRCSKHYYDKGVRARKGVEC